MSARYVPLAWRDERDDGWGERPSCQVVETCPSPVRTGLLDANGVPLYRVPERVPLGFDLGPKGRGR